MLTRFTSVNYLMLPLTLRSLLSGKLILFIFSFSIFNSLKLNFLRTYAKTIHTIHSDWEFSENWEHWENWEFYEFYENCEFWWPRLKLPKPLKLPKALKALKFLKLHVAAWVAGFRSAEAAVLKSLFVPSLKLPKLLKLPNFAPIPFLKSARRQSARAAFR